jgi:chromate reductase, NAD(P)H dehydrogenase (quinone)
MTRILGISGSLRKGSFNTALLRAAADLADDDVTVDVVTLQGIPLYDGDLEASEGIPAAVQSLKDKVVAADGVLLATPEYNNGIPGVFKNALDWMSRPADDIPRVFYGRPLALVGASPGAFGTLSAQSAWLPVLRALRVQPWFEGRLMVSGAGKLFEERRLTDTKTRERLAEFLRDFAAFAAESKR